MRCNTSLPNQGYPGSLINIDKHQYQIYIHEIVTTWEGFKIKAYLAKLTFILKLSI